MFILDKRVARHYFMRPNWPDVRPPASWTHHRPCPIAILATFLLHDLCMWFVRETQRVWNRSSDKIRLSRIKYFGWHLWVLHVASYAGTRCCDISKGSDRLLFAQHANWIRANPGAVCRRRAARHRYSCSRCTMPCLLVAHCWRLQKRETKRSALTAESALWATSLANRARGYRHHWMHWVSVYITSYVL